MHRRRFAYVLSGALMLAALPASVHAADETESEAPVMEHTSDILPDEVERRGAYVRFDVGGVVSPSPGVSIVDPPAGLMSAESGTLNGQVSVGGGVGYRFSNWFRSDLTLVHSPGRDFSAATTGSAGTGEVSGSLTSTAILASAYAEFVPESWVRPYVGAGIGAANLSLDGVAAALPAGGRQSYPDHSEWGFAWSLAAGVTLDISERVELDGGYRYINFGSVETGAASDGSRVNLDDVESHEFRVGLRILFN